MEHTIHVSGMTGYYNRFIKQVTGANKASVERRTGQGGALDSDGFLAAVGRQMDKTSAVDLKNAGVRYVEDMTMEEYRQYIFEEISSYQVDVTRLKDFYHISISEEGFEAMKQDPEYEAWVLDYIKRDMVTAAPAWYVGMGGPAIYCMLHFGATKEEQTGQMIPLENQSKESREISCGDADEGFWTSRAKRQKKYLKEAQKRADIRRRYAKALEKQVEEEKLLHQKAMERYWREMALYDGNASEPTAKLLAGKATVSAVKYLADLTVSNI